MPVLRIKKIGYKLDQSPFYCLQSKAKLATLLGVSRSRLIQLARSESLYIEKEIIHPRRKKSRLVEKPKYELKLIQKRIEGLLKRIEIPKYIHAPTKGRSYVSNAKAHLNSYVISSLDIVKYFPSTKSKRVYWFFHTRMKCSPDVAAILTKLSTYKEHLPTGSPMSPILSYFAHIDMWEEINNIVEDAGCILTVYMDDVTISGDYVSRNLIWQIKKKFHRYGLSSNTKKEKYYIGKNSRKITGVILDFEKGVLKIPNRQHKKMYSIRKQISKETHPDTYAHLMSKLKGLKSQVQQIHKANNTQTNEN